MPPLEAIAPSHDGASGGEGADRQIVEGQYFDDHDGIALSRQVHLLLAAACSSLDERIHCAVR